ncbi:hypothetical protein ONZ45_g12022 [Pleurotus djamor]|nr:hypothetical protein ONZ45_g12022 [Pleurotus djamor]
MAHVATQMASVATQMANMATQLPALDTRIAAVEAQIAEVHQGHQALRNTVGVKKDDDFIIPTRNAQGVYPYELNSPFPYHLTKNDLRSMSGPEKQRFANHYNTELNLDFNEVIFMWLGVKLD